MRDPGNEVGVIPVCQDIQILNIPLTAKLGLTRTQTKSNLEFFCHIASSKLDRVQSYER